MFPDIYFNLLFFLQIHYEKVNPVSPQVPPTVKLDVKIVWFGCQVAVCVNKQQKKQYFCVVKLVSKVQI